MFASAISAFGSIKWMRLIGFLALLWLAYGQVESAGWEEMRAFSHFHLRAQWWGILGLIGWDYLVGSTVFAAIFKATAPRFLGAW